MYINISFIVKTGDPNRENINPDKLGTLDITGAEEADIDGLFDFFARYVRKVHSDEFIRKTLKLGKGSTFIDVIGPNDIAYVIAVFKNSQQMWDQDIRMRELGKDAMGNPEKKIKPNFTAGSGQKRAKGKTLWNKEGMRYFRNAEKTWKKIYDSEEDMKVLYNGWDEWIVSKGKEITVGDGSRKTFHYVMGSWYDEETPDAKEKIDESEDDNTFGNDGGYSSDRARSRHSVAWTTGQLRYKTMKGGNRGENQNGSDESSGSEEKERTDSFTHDNSSPPLLSLPAAMSIGRAAAASKESPARNTRIASRKAEVAEKGHQKRRKMYCSDESSGSKEEERTDPETPDKSSPPLLSLPAAVSIGRAAAASKESPARNTRIASRKAEVAEKGHQKRRKM